MEHMEDIEWFWEALATNLGNPEQFDCIENISDITVEQLSNFNNLKNGYLIAYTIGKFMLENYTHDEIMEYVKYPKKLKNEQFIIISSVKEYCSINNSRKI